MRKPVLFRQVIQPQNNVLGVLESRRAANRIQHLLEDAQNKGADLPLGIHIEDTTMQPTLVLNIKPDMLLYREESFWACMHSSTFFKY